ncbi:MAG: phosphoenolpyruvate--protein phosphotransferase [Sandaracinaceae bacterium]
MSEEGARRVLRGITASPGVAVGPVQVYDPRSVVVPRRTIPRSAVDEELGRLRRAIESSRRHVEDARDALDPRAQGDHRLLLETMAMMHGDALLKEGAEETLRSQGINAEWALRLTVDSLASRLEASTEAYFRVRADDVRHVGEHILQVLAGGGPRMPELTEPVVLVARDLSPAEAAQLPSDKVLGLVTGEGSAISHTAILARALRIPAVLGIAEVTGVATPGQVAVVDGLRGEVTLAPTPAEHAEAERRAARFRAFGARLREAHRRPVVTADGSPTHVLANVELELEVPEAVRAGADGIGLYRTEFLYLGRPAPPSETEQAAVYARVLSRIAPLEVTFRTFDFGGDKLPDGWPRPANPALGLRALRLAFERPELLVTQLRALLRASSEGPLRILFPMVSGVDDMRRAVVLLERAREDLEHEDAPFGPVSVGCMLEVPAAVLTLDRLAPQVDFLNVGTNDLSQYTLAADRADPRVAHLVRGLHPAVLSLLDRARRVAADHGVPICVCGEMAADPVAIPVLLGLGYEDLSMPVAALPLAREVISRLERVECAELAAKALTDDGPRDVEKRVQEAFGTRLGDLWAEHGIDLPRG